LEQYKFFQPALYNKYMSIQEDLKKNIGNKSSIKLTRKSNKISSYVLKQMMHLSIINGTEECFLKHIIYDKPDTTKLNINGNWPFAFIYYSKDMIELAKTKKFDFIYVDGTGDILTDGMQMICIHAKMPELSTLIVAITNRYTVQNYKAIFDYVNNNVIDLRDKTMVCDFEAALQEAGKVFKAVNYCYFHYTANVNKHARKLQRNYKALCTLLTEDIKERVIGKEYREKILSEAKT